MEDWPPRAIQAGWKFWVLAVPEDVMSKLAMNEFVQSFFELGLRIMVFTDTADARSWLEAL